MRVLVTGTTAPLGAAIVLRLRATPGVELVLERSVDPTHLRQLHDLVRGEARGLGVTAVVHTWPEDVDATRELVRACTDHPTIRRFVYRSFADVYAPQTDLVDEDAPLELPASAPAWLRRRIEADASVCSHLGGGLEIAVLRCADILAPGADSHLWDYLSSHVCTHPFGFDPMINVLSVEDAAAAFAAAAASSERGVFNIAGLDTLPLARAIAESMRINIGLPAPLGRGFRFGGVLDARRAREAFGYVPRTPVRWPRPRWRRLIDELGRNRPEECQR